MPNVGPVIEKWLSSTDMSVDLSKDCQSYISNIRIGIDRAMMRLLDLWQNYFPYIPDDDKQHAYVERFQEIYADLDDIRQSNGSGCRAMAMMWADMQSVFKYNNQITITADIPDYRVYTDQLSKRVRMLMMMQAYVSHLLNHVDSADI